MSMLWNFKTKREMRKLFEWIFKRYIEETKLKYRAEMVENTAIIIDTLRFKKREIRELETKCENQRKIIAGFKGKKVDESQMNKLKEEWSKERSEYIRQIISLNTRLREMLLSEPTTNFQSL